VAGRAMLEPGAIVPADHQQERQLAHSYIDRLPESQLSAVRGLLESLLHTGAQSSSKQPQENEEIGSDEESAVAEARAWLKHNQPFAMEKVLADLGLTMADFERMGQTPIPPENGHSRH
jgi:hypothetical protein